MTSSIKCMSVQFISSIFTIIGSFRDPTSRNTRVFKEVQNIFAKNQKKI